MNRRRKKQYGNHIENIEINILKAQCYNIKLPILKKPRKAYIAHYIYMCAAVLYAIFSIRDIYYMSDYIETLRILRFNSAILWLISTTINMSYQTYKLSIGERRQKKESNRIANRARSSRKRIKTTQFLSDVYSKPFFIELVLLILAVFASVIFVVAFFCKSNTYVYVLGIIVQIILSLMSVYNTYIMCVGHMADFFEAKDVLEV